MIIGNILSLAVYGGKAGDKSDGELCDLARRFVKVVFDPPLQKAERAHKYKAVYIVLFTVGEVKMIIIFRKPRNGNVKKSQLEGIIKTAF